MSATNSETVICGICWSDSPKSGALKPIKVLMVRHFKLPAHFIGDRAHRMCVHQLAIKQTRERRLAGVLALSITSQVSRDFAAEKISVTVKANESRNEPEKLSHPAAMLPVSFFQATAAVFVPAPKPVTATLNPRATAFEPLKSI